jgi:hypothetical protein
VQHDFVLVVDAFRLPPTSCLQRAYRTGITALALLTWFAPFPLRPDGAGFPRRSGRTGFAREANGTRIAISEECGAFLQRSF